LDEAVAQWASANGCKITIPARVGNEPDCPSPVIVAAAGGASRASFFLGAVIGKLIDERQGTDSRNYRPFEKQLFAISGVSGGSVGAVMTYAALADGKRQQVAVGSDRETRSSPPCVDSRASGDRQWFMTETGELGPANQPGVSWKSCLELMLSGDFLSPVFASLLGTDLVGIGHDRAVTLEQAWERRYSDMTGRNTLAETMSSVRSRATAQHVWLPILFLNGTSVETGRRIITSDIQTSRVGPQNPQHETSETSDNALFRDFYDLNELLGSSSRSEAQNTAFGYERKLSVLRSSEKDVALSTAGTMSARFPFISPHGTIRGRDHQFVDHVVDGGYFENFGATTALELAQVLYNRYRLTPTLMLVDNEPSTSAMECVFPEGEEKSIPEANSINLFTDFSSTLHAMLETRTARATLAAVELCGFAKDTKGTFAYIRVRPESEKPLSMSWWLSKHVQKYLDLQLVDSLNAHAFDLVRERRLATSAKPETGSN
jgi:hypothetical protein